jgi:hypothetical protein
LITFYSDQRYRKAAYRLKRQALKSDQFASVVVWNPRLIRKKSPSSYKKLQMLRNAISPSNDGYGLWFWKPVIIENSLKMFTDGSILVYLDAGCYLNLNNPKAIARFQEYIKLTATHGSLAMQLIDGEFDIDDLSEASWTSTLVMNGLALEHESRISNQIQAGIQFLVCNRQNLEFVSKWRVHCENNNFLYLIGASSHNSKNFPAHRYDQSVFSCLYKIESRFCIPDETYFEPNWKSQGVDFPIWAIRNRDGIDPFNPKVSDLLARILRRLRLFIGKRYV